MAMSTPPPAISYPPPRRRRQLRPRPTTGPRSTTEPAAEGRPAHGGGGGTCRMPSARPGAECSGWTRGIDGPSGANAAFCRFAGRSGGGPGGGTSFPQINPDLAARGIRRRPSSRPRLREQTTPAGHAARLLRPDGSRVQPVQIHLNSPVPSAGSESLFGRRGGHRRPAGRGGRAAGLRGPAAGGSRRTRRTSSSAPPRTAPSPSATGPTRQLVGRGAGRMR